MISAKIIKDLKIGVEKCSQDDARSLLVTLTSSCYKCVLGFVLREAIRESQRDQDSAI